MDKIIISLTGVKKSGKSTAASIIENMINCKNIAIADKLKKELSKAYDIDLLFFYDQNLKEQSLIYPITTKIETFCSIIEAFKIKDKVSINSNILLDISTKKIINARELMQVTGMYLRKIYGKKIHMDHLDLSEDVTIVSDLRMKSEFDYISNLKGYKHIPIYVQNTEAEAVGDLHPSEKEYLKFKSKCIRLDNNVKDFDTLADNIENILIKYRKELDL